MGTKQRRTNVVVGVLAVAGLLWVFSMAGAGNLEPSAPPAPTMKSLDEIYNAGTSHLSEREGYCQSFNVPHPGTTTLLTVPPSKRLVLLRLYLPSKDQILLTVNDSLFIDSASISYAVYDLYHDGGSGYSYIHDFPDRCVVVNAGTLRAVGTATSGISKITLVGYFYDVQ